MSTSGSFAGGPFLRRRPAPYNPFLTGWPVQQSAGSSPLSTRCAPARTDEEVLTYALLPATAANFLKRKYGVERASNETAKPRKAENPEKQQKSLESRRDSRLF